MRKVALVTGGSRGIGAAIARRLAREGYQVAVGYRTGQKEAQALADSLGRGVAVAVGADVADAAQVQAMVEQVQQQLGEVTLLVNNAGFAQQKLFTDLTAQEWERVFAVHVGGAFHCCQAVLPSMIRRKDGCILNISSIWGQAGASCEVGYSAAKAALIGLTKGLAKELGPSGIRVNCIAPGVIDTQMNRQLGPEALSALAEETPLQRLGTPEEVAALAAFLAGDEASFITGQVLAINGGLYI